MPWPAHPATLSESAIVPFGHSPVALMRSRAAAGVSPGAAAAMRAMIPETCGVAIDVPEDVFHPPSFQVE